jgi:hypothetical protein
VVDTIAFPAIYVFLCTLLIVRRQYFARMLAERSAAGRAAGRALSTVAGARKDIPEDPEAEENRLRRCEWSCVVMGSVLIALLAVDIVIRHV